MVREVAVGDAVFGGGRPLVLIAGPCVVEEEALTLRIAGFLRRLAEDLGIGLVFKASFDKANRTSGEPLSRSGHGRRAAHPGPGQGGVRPAGRLRYP